VFLFIFHLSIFSLLLLFFFNHTPTTEIYTLSLHDALPISPHRRHPSHGPGHVRHRPYRQDQRRPGCRGLHRLLRRAVRRTPVGRSEEHTSELQSRGHLVCRLLLEKKKNKISKEET